jgi:hypothetical protein
MHVRLMFLFACLSSATVQAQVYQCTDENGSVTFSDRPCANDAKLVTGLEDGNSGIAPGGDLPQSSLTLGDGSIQPFKKIVSIEVKTQTGYKTGKEGLHVFYDGTDHVVKFEDMESLTVVTWDRDSCGNTAHLCEPSVRIVTKNSEIISRYEALRNITILIDDKLDGVEKEMTVWFGNRNRPHIREVRF